MMTEISVMSAAWYTARARARATTETFVSPKTVYKHEENTLSNVRRCTQASDRILLTPCIPMMTHGTLSHM